MNAFPQASYNMKGGYDMTGGMTLRDYFAAKAIAVIMPAVVAELQKRSYSSDKTKQLKTAAAEACYGLADAMMEARK